MLVGSGVRYGGGPMRALGGASAGSLERWRWEQRGATLNTYAGEATVIGGASIANKNGVPSGYLLRQIGITLLPATAAPIGLSKDGLPIGLQFVGPMFGDALVLRAAPLLGDRSATGWAWPSAAPSSPMATAPAW